MHAVTAVLGSFAVLAVAYRTCVRCKRSQSASFRDRADPRRNITYQPLPSTQVV